MADEDYQNGEFTQEGLDDQNYESFEGDNADYNNMGDEDPSVGEGGDGDLLQGGDSALSLKDSTDEERSAFILCRKLFVGGLSWETTQKDLKEYFTKYGDITEVNIKTDPNTGRSRGFAFIQFAVKESVDQVLTSGPHTVSGKQVDPKRAKARPGIKKIFVGGLDPDLPEGEIHSHFEKFGKIEEIELPFDKQKNQRRQFCFITFESEDVVDEICKQPKQKIGNKDCDVKKATPKQDPRAMRGGWGSWGGGYGGGGRGGGGGGGGGRGRGVSQNQGWAGNQNYNCNYNQGYGSYNQGYGGYSGGYSGYDNYYGYGSGYDYSGWGGYGQGGYSGGYGQQQSSYGKTRRGGGGGGGSGGHGYHPYTR
uniref:RRM domain-containing protein n=1 Tax=Strigamia maritima TaxID=126957 RepID=T1IXR2_STRMM